jgi:tetratricopeptide (TPR) repeat protein
MEKIKIPIAVLAPILMIGWATITVFAQTGSSAPPPFDVTKQQQAAKYMRTEIQTVADRLLKDFPEDVSLTNPITQFYQESKSPRRVMDILRQALKYNPENYNLVTKAARVASKNGMYDESFMYWKKAIQIQPSKVQIQINLADVLMSLGRYQEAVGEIESKIVAAGASARDYWLLGQCYMQLRDYEKAKDYYQRAHQNGPEQYENYHYDMSKVYMRLKQPEKAKKHMEIARKKKIEIRRDAHDKAKNAEDAVVDDSAGSELFVFSKSLANLCVRGVKLYNDETKIQNARQLFDNAHRIFEKAITITQDNADIYREFAYMYLMTGTYLDKALPLAEKAVELKQQAQNYYVLSHLYYQNSQPDNALAAIKKAMELEPRNIRYKQFYNNIKMENAE